MIERLRNPLDRGERLERVRRYLRTLGLTHYGALVFGSVARGEFTAERDTDLLVVSDELPGGPRRRIDVLFEAQHRRWSPSAGARRTGAGASKKATPSSSSSSAKAWRSAMVVRIVRC
ncbi:MAG: nucleotidyltransferase domain-containing protein [Gammaproteobacteria bacterium]|nr:nucleotidyltransferase domain-containing protein [Gammaproteobacteria bacterium]NIR81982.1 nucleotidyltransferase domain-containing protein [Gammaproteobacteria bacterium]NIR89038.1 nucleotidyltransferase domain-containing protein [Gammaproteobacteria bacterium]NIU03089.1 nucleotidyltransferase domain-containing protein [Gammaproteobacteria bacterium]NIV50613.1 hypothetical protein [Gammaproteobacteria bacterium]